jgi:hypothetical protein
MPLSSRRAERFDQLIDGRRPVMDMRERTRLDIVTALRARTRMSPREEFRASLRARLLTATPDTTLPDVTLPDIDILAADSPATGDRAPARGARAAVRARPVLIGALATSVAVTGIAVTTHRALPGEPFYGLKLHVEQIQLDLASSRVERAKLHLDIARTRLDEIHTIMSNGRLSAKTAEVRALLTAWRTEASAGGDVLADEARNGSADALRAVRDFTADQSRNLRAILEELPRGQLHTLTSDALDYVRSVDHTLHPESTASPGTGGPVAVPTQVTGSPTQEPDRTPESRTAGSKAPEGTSPVRPSPTPVPSADLPATPRPSATTAAGVPAAATTSPATAGNRQATPAPTSPRTPTATPSPTATDVSGTVSNPVSSTPSTGTRTDPDPGSILSNLLHPTTTG